MRKGDGWPMNAKSVHLSCLFIIWFHRVLFLNTGETLGNKTKTPVLKELGIHHVSRSSLNSKSGLPSTDVVEDACLQHNWIPQLVWIHCWACLILEGSGLYQCLTQCLYPRGVSQAPRPPVPCQNRTSACSRPSFEMGHGLYSGVLMFEHFVKGEHRRKCRKH